MRASRATWLTHADTSVTAGRLRGRARRPASGTGGGRRALPAATAARISPADAAAAVPLVDAAGLGQLLDRRRLALGDAEDGQVGQHLAHRDVGRRRLAARATPPRPGPRPAPAGAATGRPSASATPSRGRSPPVGRVRSSSHASSTHAEPAELGAARRRAGRAARAGRPRRRRRTRTGRRSAGGAASRSAGRPWPGVTPSSPCSSDDSDGVP